MLTAIEIDGAAIPCAARVSGAYAAKAITTREYNAALRVAVLEDSVKRPFYVAAWADVQVGDIVLMAWPTGRRIDVAKVKITKPAADPTLNNEQLVAVIFQVDGLLYGRTFGRKDVAYVQSGL